MEAVLDFGRGCQILAIILRGVWGRGGGEGPEMRRKQATSFITSGRGGGVTLQLFALHIHVVLTVQTVDDVLRQGEHIPKMQNDIGRKSTLAVLRWTGRTHTPYWSDRYGG
jgi:hypothetical protein